MKNFDIQLDEEYAQKLAYIQQEADQDTVEAIKSSIELRYQQLQQQKTDPLAKLKQSKFIGCFKGEADLAANSEAIVRSLMQENYDYS
ncbi:MAG: CopG family transcriptional regulator [Nostoc sp. DedQUE04]|uniref:CopG family transcriptional regulator n=1 Tax=Nostoc sp. DedQUE04 TaxID=3075390 RepID=UPI002AD21352|nr:CopG family transcriptional regulator [Nostoc sp. DedQUE04]MDZ8136142.1 CopG family transcriptional regulator [Nostoc sp. DedQUE04]